MNGLLSFLFILVLMNTPEGAAMEPERRSPTTKASRSRQSRGARVVAKFVEQPRTIPIKKSGSRRSSSAIDLSKQNSLEDSKSDEQLTEHQESQRWEILMQAIKSYDLDVVTELLQYKADLKYLNYCDAEFNTPLLCAIFISNQGDETQRRCNYSIVQKLLENKADVNPWCNSPMQVAHLMGNKNIIELLHKAKIHRCTHSIEIDPEERDQVHNYMGSVRMLRRNWQCECGLCAYVLQGEYMVDSHVRLNNFVHADLGLTPEKWREITQKEEEERTKRWAGHARTQSLVLRDERGNYSDPKNPNPVGTFDALMKPK